ncbi:cell envelope integrity protein CreD [Arcticibacter sp.]|uniref:cell envelope integrity protein CreD n=1 Tax=Arcticibacter sp. TaxID=1872630 RepID=UPI00388D6418
MENNLSKTSGLVSWIGDSVLFKLGIIGFLTLLLLIPSEWIQSLIRERQSRHDEVLKDISDKWSSSQLLQGPVMILPYRTVKQVTDASGKVSHEEMLTNVYILPEKLSISSKVEPEVRHRGIFDAVVYNAKVNVSGSFSPLELAKSGINPEGIVWNKAKVVIGLSDLKGLKNNPTIQLDNRQYGVEPDFANLELFTNNLIIVPDLSKEKKTSLTFSFVLDLRGSTELNFLHLGKNTEVNIEGSWPDPSFTGRYLPEKQKVDNNAFSAQWKIPFFNRPYPQQWIADNTRLNTSNETGTEPPHSETVSQEKKIDEPFFGVKFLLPIDQYQKTMRTAKYSFLIILLTFLSLFFTELLYKKKVHILQYVLIGAAMTIYYTLLLAFSERIGFNSAYLLASTSTVLLISMFIGTLLNSRKPALIFGSILTTFYIFIFVIIQLQDLALIFGSVGLFITVAVMMYLSAKMDWNQQTLSE